VPNLELLHSVSTSKTQNLAKLVLQWHQVFACLRQAKTWCLGDGVMKTTKIN